MTEICRNYVEAYVGEYKRELDSLTGFQGASVVDTSFLNGFLKRRILRDGIYFTLAEAWHAERLCAEKLLHAATDSMSFPPATRREFSRGVDRLERQMHDPYSALVDRWGGRGGEPALAEYKIEPVSREHVRVARAELREFIVEARRASHVQRTLPSEAFLDKPYRQVQLEQGKDSPRKRYFNPEVVEFLGPNMKALTQVGDNRGAFREVSVRPIQAVGVNFANKGNDRETFDLCRSIAKRMPVQLLTSDGDHKRMIRSSRFDPNMTVVFDYEGKIETVR